MIPFFLGCTTEAGSTEAFTAIAEAATWADHVTVTVADGSMSFESNGLPDHATNEVYAGLDQTGTVEVVPEEQDHAFTISLSPALAASSTGTDHGHIGPAVSGAVFFNPFDATGEYALELEVDSEYAFIDDCGGHPTPDAGEYHYHGVPVCTSAAIDVNGEHSGVVGFLFDGFPIYGPNGEGGDAPSDLDECMGHTGAVPETDEEVYHYHTSTSNPYIVNCYSGTPDVPAMAH